MTTRSYRPMQHFTGGEVVGNGQRFATEEEARLSASARFARWTAPCDYSVEPSEDPVNYKRVDGNDIMLPDPGDEA